MKIQTEELAGVFLNAAVAQAEGHDYYIARYRSNGDLYCAQGEDFCGNERLFLYLENWSAAGPIYQMMVEEGMVVQRDTLSDSDGFLATLSTGGLINNMQHGTTVLEAAMRCFVSFKVGPEIEFPEHALLYLRQMIPPDMRN